MEEWIIDPWALEDSSDNLKNRTPGTFDRVAKFSDLIVIICEAH